MNNSRSYFSNLRSQVKKVGEKKIVERRTELASNVLRRLIKSSPVYTGTYANAHTVYINGNALRKPVIYFFNDEAIVKSISNSKIYIESLMKVKALLGIETFEIPHLKNTNINDKISISFDESMVYWGGSYYVEKAYGVYEQAKRMYSSISSNNFMSKGIITRPFVNYISFHSDDNNFGVFPFSYKYLKLKDNEKQFTNEYNSLSDENISKLISELDSIRYDLVGTSGLYKREAFNVHYNAYAQIEILEG